ncbi:hypothetical protein HMPREF1868_01652 [Olsenella sp. DNF00959]|nr:hypothetical protein HMPREF1868_01652 [Olsenella sp. DNF00959]
MVPLSLSVVGPWCMGPCDSRPHILSKWRNCIGTNEKTPVRISMKPSLTAYEPIFWRRRQILLP